MKYEIRDCDKGEVNYITKEYFCNAYQEFCKHIDYCAIKTLQKRLRND